MSEATDSNVLAPGIPLCFDTNAIFSTRIYGALKRVRARFPERGLLVPVIVVAERARQLRRQFGSGFNWEMIRNFLDDRYLRLDVVGFARSTVVPGEGAAPGALGSPWLSVVGEIEEKAWEAAEKARFADHAVYAAARERSAILVTNDGPLRRQAAGDAYLPGTTEMDRLLQLCA